ncbi:hypothetical protein MMG00_05640 [Ignatzschineria rhizosphaerae]|uniref:Uncharacterized protein n=1 Tax=Ignatzschineria rhizosphaerae TaxID=2923279 RepID=A0ABY3X379_9GAMM|nr:hypothetical protein [Ignatzschineria rhizosphaerae]UNM97331.1 hypothetical protein MMG00_05640 [Ignatzschineria rhizosphaerae]
MKMIKVEDYYAYFLCSILCLVASISHGQEYVIHGFKLGGPVSEIEGFDDYSLTSDTEAGTLKYYQDILIDGIDTTVYVRVLDNHAEELVFSRSAEKKDVETIIISIEAQLGLSKKDRKYDVQGDTKLIFHSEQDDILYNISIMQTEVREIGEIDMQDGYQTKKDA